MARDHFKQLQEVYASQFHFNLLAFVCEMHFTMARDNGARTGAVDEASSKVGCRVSIVVRRGFVP